jgi:hypothetical protein
MKQRRKRRRKEEKKNGKKKLWVAMVVVATLVSGLRPRQGLAKVQAKSEAWESHFMFSGMQESVRE